MAHIALFARMHWPELKEPLGFHRDHPPHATTISRTLAGVPYEQLQGSLTEWVARVVADQELNASVDGKWAKQSKDAQGNPLMMLNVLAQTQLLLAVAAGTGDVLMARLREGRANTARGGAHFLRETVGRVRYGGARGQLTVRADSGLLHPRRGRRLSQDEGPLLHHRAPACQPAQSH